MVENRGKSFIPQRLDVTKTKTFPVWDRKNLVTVHNMARPGIDFAAEYASTEFDELVNGIVEARKNNRPVI